MTDSFSLDGPWSLGEEKYRILVSELLNTLDVQTITEFGSGPSTVRLALDFPDAEVFSLDDKEKYYRRTREQIEKANVKNIHLMHAPLVWQRTGIRVYRTYSMRNLVSALGARKVDFVLIDGPVESETLRGREGVFYRLFSHVRSGGYIALDDYHRESAQSTVRNWMASYSDAIDFVTVIGQGLVIVTKKRNGQCSLFPGVTPLLDNWMTIPPIVFRAVKQRIPLRPWMK